MDTQNELYGNEMYVCTYPTFQSDRATGTNIKVGAKDKESAKIIFQRQFKTVFGENIPLSEIKLLRIN